MDVMLIDTQGSKVSRVVDESRRGTWTVFDVTSDLVVAQFASPCTAPQLVSETNNIVEIECVFATLAPVSILL